MGSTAIQLTPAMRDDVDAIMRDGRYADEEAAVAAALRAMAEWAGDPDEVHSLAKLIQEGVDDISAGRCRKVSSPEELDSVMKEIRHAVDLDLGKARGT